MRAESFLLRLDMARGVRGMAKFLGWIFSAVFGDAQAAWLRKYSSNRPPGNPHPSLGGYGQESKVKGPGEGGGGPVQSGGKLKKIWQPERWPQGLAICLRVTPHRNPPGAQLS